MRNFDNDILSVIMAFEKMTGSEVRDCICAEAVYFLLSPGTIAQTIGRNGQNIKAAERMLGKPIKVFEWAENDTDFIKNMIAKAVKIDLRETKATVTISQEDRGAIIGKEGNNIKAIREFLTRNSNIKELKLLP
jgi:transcription termination/antitermination protein NusA